MTRTDPAVAVRTAQARDLETVTEMLTEAFLAGPVGDWLIPDLDVRRRVYASYFAIHVDHAHQHGHIDVTDDLSGAALWFAHTGPGPVADLVDYGERLAAACGPWLRRFRAIDDTFGRHHPTTPHDYLAFVGVGPGRQRHGVGSALLAHHHAGLDGQGMPAYLEASTGYSRDLYLRHGYRVAAIAPLYLPEDGPPVWPMWRKPSDTTGVPSGQGRA